MFQKVLKRRERFNFKWKNIKPVLKWFSLVQHQTEEEEGGGGGGEDGGGKNKVKNKVFSLFYTNVKDPILSWIVHHILTLLLILALDHLWAVLEPKFDTKKHVICLVICMKYSFNITCKNSNHFLCTLIVSPMIDFGVYIFHTNVHF